MAQRFTAARHGLSIGSPIPHELLVAIVCISAAILGQACSSNSSNSAPSGGQSSSSVQAVARRAVQALIDNNISAFNQQLRPDYPPDTFPHANLTGCVIKDVLVPSSVDLEPVSVTFAQACGRTSGGDAVTGCAFNMAILNNKPYVQSAPSCQ